MVAKKTTGIVTTTVKYGGGISAVRTLPKAKGKRPAVIILHERYGVSPNQMHWYTCEPEGAGFLIPADVRLTLANEDVEGMLLRS